LIGGRLLPSEARPAAQFMYENAGKKRLTLYLRAAPDTGEVAFRILQDGGFTAAYWLDQPLGYALIAEAERETVLALARQVHAQLGH
jgi:anti-sigma factor RsiW